MWIWNYVFSYLFFDNKEEEMKIINQILKLILILGSLSYFRINAHAAVETMVNKKQIPYEILNISLVDNSIVIEGWVFISYKQHYLNDSDHKTELEFFSVNDSFRVQAKLTNISLTKQMEYFGSPKCAPVAIGQAPEFCNYNYENVGFIATIPLNKFKIDTEIHYSDTEKTNEYNKQLINIIDEPLIKYQLKQMYMEFVKDDEYINSEIKRLENLKSKIDA